MSQRPFQASARATIYSDLENVNLNYNLQTLKQDNVNAKDQSYREGCGPGVYFNSIKTTFLITALEALANPYISL